MAYHDISFKLRSVDKYNHRTINILILVISTLQDFDMILLTAMKRKQLRLVQLPFIEAPNSVQCVS